MIGVRARDNRVMTAGRPCAMERVMAYAHIPALRLTVLVPALILGIGLPGMPDSELRAAEWPAGAYVLQVDGLACPYCGYGVEKQFQKRDGVESTEIDMENGVVIVHVTPGTSFSEEQLRRIIHDAGFELGELLQRPGAS